jgi:hypothetical protein
MDNWPIRLLEYLFSFHLYFLKWTQISFWIQRTGFNNTESLPKDCPHFQMNRTSLHIHQRETTIDIYIYIYIYIYRERETKLITLSWFITWSCNYNNEVQWGLLHQIKKCHVGWEEKTNQLSTQGSLSGCFSINNTIGTILMIRLRHYARSMPSWQRKPSIFLFFHLLLAIASEYCTVLCHPIIYSQLQCFNDWC